MNQLNSKRGKNINLFLLDGNPNGIKKCTLSNWTGIAFQIPRSKLDECKSRKELQHTGVYFLFGESLETNEKLVYIGQADKRSTDEGIYRRLAEHSNPNEDYWSEAVVFVTANNTFGPTEISYLENRFWTLATEANRYEIKNSKMPPLGNITEEKESELLEFIDNAKILMGVLGHTVLEPFKRKVNTESIPLPSKDNTIFYIKVGYKDKDSNSKKYAIAEGIRDTADGFIVTEGSYISRTEVDSCPSSAKAAREKYASIIDENSKLTKDLFFESPSGAASFVLGRSASGYKEWKTKTGETLSKIENPEMKDPENDKTDNIDSQ